MAKGAKKVEIPPERVAEIIADGKAGTNWAREVNYGPACRCGIRRNALNEDDGTCPRHPGERGNSRSGQGT